MELLCQALFGAGLSTSFSRSHEIRLVALTGLLGGLIPTIDWLYRVAGPPVDLYSQKGWITYSFVFIPVGALIAATLVFVLRRLLETPSVTNWKTRREPRYSSGRVLVSRQFEIYRDTRVPPKGPPLTFHRLYCFAFASLLGPGIYRAAGSSGATLLWPFNDRHITWNLFHALDPVLILLLSSGLFFALFLKDKKPARWGILACCLYALLAVHQRERAENALEGYAGEKNHHIEKLEALPTWGNINLKRGIYKRTRGKIHLCAINLPMIGRARIYPGPSLPQLQPEKLLPSLPDDSRPVMQLKKFLSASRGFASPMDIHGRIHVVDLRRSPVPNIAIPRVSLEIHDRRDTITGDAEFPLVISSESPHSHRLSFFRMWMGQDLPEDTAE